MNKYFLLTMLLLFQSLYSQPLDDIEFIDRSNLNDTLLVMISGYQGFNDWDDFKELFTKDDKLAHFDILIIGMKKKLGVETNAERVQNVLLNDKYQHYQNEIILSFSLGGFVAKQYVLEQVDSNRNTISKLDYMIFIGTPYIEDGFTISAFKRAAGWVLRPFLPDALKDAVKNDKLSKISSAWYQQIEQKTENRIPNITIFGRDDRFVQAEKNDSLIGESVIIGGTHRELVENINDIDCSYMIVKTKLLDPTAKINIDEMGCVDS